MTISVNSSSNGGLITFNSSNNTLTIDGNVIADNLSSVAYTGDYRDLINAPSSQTQTVTDQFCANDGTSWYRIWGDGVKECGGKYDCGGVTDYFNYTVTFPVNYTTEPSIVVSALRGEDIDISFAANVGSFSATSATIHMWRAGSGGGRFVTWYAVGR